MLVNTSGISLVGCDGMPGDTPGDVNEAFLDGEERLAFLYGGRDQLPSVADEMGARTEIMLWY
jgi:hypothetical protein